MKRMLHAGVVVAVVAVMGLSYWSIVRAQQESGGGASEDFSVTGVIQSIDSSSIIIDGTTYQINDSTQIEGTPGAGDTVTLDYVINGDGTFTAQEVQSETDESPQDINEPQDQEQDLQETDDSSETSQEDDQAVQEDDQPDVEHEDSTSQSHSGSEQDDHEDGDHGSETESEGGGD